MSNRKSSRRATVESHIVTQPVVSTTSVEHNATVGEVAPAVAVQARAGATRSGGLVDRAHAATKAGAPPKFCGCCCEPRRGLTRVVARSKGITGVYRAQWLCVDCVGLGALADFAQCDVRQERGGGGKRKGGSPGGYDRGGR